MKSRQYKISVVNDQLQEILPKQKCNLQTCSKTQAALKRKVKIKVLAHQIKDKEEEEAKRRERTETKTKRRKKEKHAR